MAIRFQDGTTIYPGAVLALRERNYWDDSDFYAVVWDGHEVTEVEYATTRFAGGGSAQVDATDDVRAAAGDWLVAWADKGIRLSYAAAACSVSVIGREVVVAKGRREGAAGVVRRIHAAVMTAGAGRWREKRLLVESEGGLSFWVNASDCRVVDPWADMHASDEDIRRAAERFRRDWSAPSRGDSLQLGLVALP